MKKKLLLSLIIVLSVFLVTGCQSKTPDYKLEIKESSWSGWDPDYEPEEETNEYEVEKDKKYSINSGNLEFTIVKVDKDSITIQTTTAFSDLETGIDLSTDKKEFTIKLNKTVELTTPTMDAGNIYYLTLKKK